VAQRQAQPDDPKELAKLAKLTKADVQSIGDDIAKLEGVYSESNNVSFWEMPTRAGGIMYTKLVIDVTQDMTKTDLGYLKVVSRLMKRVPTEKYQTVKLLNQAIENTLGELDFYVDVNDTENGAAIHFIVDYSYLEKNAR